MILTSISLQNFRSYKKQSFQFSPTTTLIVGPNTAGKTNILEAIALLATGKSFRAGRDLEMIRWDEELSRVGMVVGDTKLETIVTAGIVASQKTPTKKYLVNGVSRKLIDFLGNVRVVLFWPQHLDLVTDSPSVRRKFLNSVLVQVDREYRRNLLSYERGLRQRNSLLERIKEGLASRSQLLFWDQLLIKSGGYITDARAAFIDFMNKDTDYSLLYDKSVISESRLEQYKDEEVAAKATLVGPHRDDMIFYKNNKDLAKYGSRGEQRLAVLWAKLSELSFIQEKVGERPILLLDDIFSELDDDHKQFVLETIGKQQTIVTSADLESIEMLKSHDHGIITL